MDEDRDLFISFYPEKFKRSFSYRDVLTAASLALLFTAINEILLFYSGEEFLKNNYRGVFATFFFLLLLANHTFYKFEHKRTNNYIGRILQDALYIFFCWILKLIQYYIEGASVSVDTGTFIIGIFFVGICLLVIEVLVAILKRIMSLFKCAIF